MKEAFLVETALLGQGLQDCDEKTLATAWQKRLPMDLSVLVWLWRGEIIMGGIEEFLSVRQAPAMGRYNRYTLAKAVSEGRSGFLTAGATMAVAAEVGKKLVVSCGIGGITDKEVSSDYPALCDLEITLLATAVKDMFAVAPVLAYLHKRGVKVYGLGRAVADGYLFVGEEVSLDGAIEGLSALPSDCRLVLRGIAPELRLRDRRLLRRAVAEGEAAQAAGGFFHPAVNAALTRFSTGKTSLLQLHALLDNAREVWEMAN